MVPGWESNPHDSFESQDSAAQDFENDAGTSSEAARAVCRGERMAL